MHFPVVICNTSVHLWKDSSGMPRLCRYGPFDSHHAFKMGSLDDPLQLEEKKKPYRARLFQYCAIPLN